MTNKVPVVDDADVDHIVEIVTQVVDFTKKTPEERADVAQEAALLYGNRQGHTNEWSRELARKVRARMLWVKSAPE